AKHPQRNCRKKAAVQPVLLKHIPCLEGHLMGLIHLPRHCHIYHIILMHMHLSILVYLFIHLHQLP
ncbi:hypothetical protein C351_02307, partial [Cryptococcus neoformans c8]